MTRVCLLTGASGQLGTAFIARYADRYQIVAVHHRRPIFFPTQHQEFINPLGKPQPQGEPNAFKVHAIRADIARPEAINEIVHQALGRYGRVDMLINAATVRRFSPLLANEMDADAAHVFCINVLAPLRLSAALARTFWRIDIAANQRFNRNIVNLGSTAGLYVYPDSGQALYASSKAALHHLTYHLASEFWDLGVRANAVAPDTFPGRVAIDEVLDAIVAFDTSDGTGQIQQLTPRSNTT
jgi:NAD(P)-dependent dehydrogenase (short-subunit alcohol dehydrogenase family)